jgi:AdoMet-dependent heme synthase
MGSHHRVYKSNRELFLKELDHYDLYGFTPSPFLVQWMVWGGCSMGCPHCLLPEKEVSFAFDREKRHRFLDEIKELGISELLLTGGEPVEFPLFSEIIGELAERNIKWSLNSATMPSKNVQDAISLYPPSFVAISLDGPEAFHDEFRGKKGAYQDAMSAIAFYRSVTEHVAMGTTITSLNLPLLEEFFPEVIASGATEWGFHTVFSVGRAKGKPEFVLTKDEKVFLLDFATRARSVFPVNLGDEIGYLGYREPLIRDTPFYCGAGRTQCVVSPGGDLFPCTITEAKYSEGNFLTSSIGEIWTDGFSYFRRGRLDAKCGKCNFKTACGGGCWLQSLSGNHCEKTHWYDNVRIPKAVGTAIAVGLAACGTTAKDDTTTLHDTTENQIERKTDTVKKIVVAKGPAQVLIGKQDALEYFIIDYLKFLTGKSVGMSKEKVLKPFHEKLKGDKGAAFFLKIIRGKVPSSISILSREVTDALITSQRSMMFGVFVFKYFMEGINSANPPEKRTPQENLLIRVTLNRLHMALSNWRVQVFDNKLSPFWGRSGAMIFRASMSKAGGFRYRNLTLNTIYKARYGLRRASPITKELLDSWPLGKSKDIKLSLKGGISVVRGSVSREGKVDDVISIFDLLTTPPYTTKTLKKPMVTFNILGKKLPLSLPYDATFTWFDIIVLLNKTHSDIVETIHTKTGWSNSRYYNYKTYLLPEIRRVYDINIKNSSKPDIYKFHKLSLWFF